MVHRHPFRAGVLSRSCGNRRGDGELAIGPGVTDPYSRHPAITAATIATLDEISGGRAQLGLGTGGYGFKELGLEKKLPVAALRETIEIVRGLLAGANVDVRGKVVSLADGKLGFQPVRDKVPIYIATHGPQISRLAGKLADGVLIANTLLPNMFDLYLSKLQEGLASAKRPLDELDIGLRIEACISDDYDAAFAVMRRRMAARLIGQFPHWDYLKEMGVDVPDAFAEVAAKKDQSLVDEAARLMPPEIVKYTVLAGNPERVANQLAGVLRPEIKSLTIRPHCVAGGTVEDVLRAFATDVIPRVERIVSER